MSGNTLGSVLADCIKSRGWDVRRAAREVGLSRAWLYELIRGDEKASYPVAAKLAAVFTDRARDIWLAAGYPQPESVAPSLPPGARLIGHGKPLPKGPSLHAGSAVETGDPTYETHDLNEDARESGADYLITVKGDCLAPHLVDGDTVAVKFQNTARNAQVVVAQVLSDFHGELGDALTLKVYRTSGQHGRGYYRADGTMSHGASEAKIVGVVVKHYPAKAPTVR